MLIIDIGADIVVIWDMANNSIWTPITIPKEQFESWVKAIMGARKNEN